MSTDQNTPTGVAVARRLPGKARPRAEALQEYQDHIAKVRGRIDERWGKYSPVGSLLKDVHAPDPDKRYRWRVQLDCGCIHEVLTRGDKDLPARGRWLDPINNVALPEGQILCPHNDSPPAPYREISEWGNRDEEPIPADPAEPPDWVSDDPEAWAKLRHDKPRACWSVTLSCGHATKVIVDDLDWKPSDGPSRTPFSANEQANRLARMEQLWASHPDLTDQDEREHYLRRIAEGNPHPDPEQRCYTCPQARRIVAYERIGPLATPTRQPKPHQPPSRASVEKRLQQAERTAAKLREQLAQLDAAEGSAEPGTEG